MDVGSLQETITVSAEEPRSVVTNSSPGGTPVAVAAGAAVAAPRSALRYDSYDQPSPRFNNEAYDHIEESGLRRVAKEPLSTFSIDVDTASYANVRRFLTDA